MGIGSEVAQGLLPVREHQYTAKHHLLRPDQNGRDFDPYDILANVVGSAIALALCSWYHRRMLERKRKNKHYDIVPGDELDELDDRDVELGEGVETTHEQETGVVAVETPTVTEELDNWDENAEEWEEDEPEAEVKSDDKKIPSTLVEDGSESKKRSD